MFHLPNLSVLNFRFSCSCKRGLHHELRRGRQLSSGRPDISQFTIGSLTCRLGRRRGVCRPPMRSRIPLKSDARLGPAIEIDVGLLRTGSDRAINTHRVRVTTSRTCSSPWWRIQTGEEPWGHDPSLGPKKRARSFIKRPTLGFRTHFSHKMGRFVGGSLTLRLRGLWGGGGNSFLAPSLRKSWIRQCPSQFLHLKRWPPSHVK